MENAQPKRIAVIGAGAKGVALATKAWALRRAGMQYSPEIVIFEKLQVGSLWSGDHGYSDGYERLCTPIERDLGFPYFDSVNSKNPDFDSQPFSKEHSGLESDEEPSAIELHNGVSLVMLNEFSFQSYLIQESSSLKTNRHLDFVNKNRRSFTHRQFHYYLEWALKQTERDIGEAPSPVTVKLGAEVLEIDHDTDIKKWKVTYQRYKSKGSESTNPNIDPITEIFDAVIISGVGEAKKPKTETIDAPAVSGVGETKKPSSGWTIADDNPRYFNACSFWIDGYAQIVSYYSHGKGMQKLKDKKSPETSYSSERAPEVIILGNGGAAWSIAAKLAQLLPSLDILMLGRKSAPLARNPNSYVENYYGNNVSWSSLSVDKKLSFNNLWTQGAVWNAVVCQVDTAENIIYRSENCSRCNAPSIKVDNTCEVFFEDSPNIESETPLESDFIIDSRGFETTSHIIKFFDESELSIDIKRGIEYLEDTSKELSKDRTNARIATDSNGVIFIELGKDHENENSGTDDNIKTTMKQSLGISKYMELRGDESTIPAGLHIPELCNLVGPAASNLMALGWLADTILTLYIDK